MTDLSQWYSVILGVRRGNFIEKFSLFHQFSAIEGNRKIIHNFFRLKLSKWGKPMVSFWCSYWDLCQYPKLSKLGKPIVSFLLSVLTLSSTSNGFVICTSSDLIPIGLFYKVSIYFNHVTLLKYWLISFSPLQHSKVSASFSYQQRSPETFQINW